MATKCPRCGESAESLTSIDARLMERLSDAGNGDLPPAVCMNCYTSLAGSVSRGSVLLAKEKAKEQHKMVLWKSRVNLVKQARALMGAKAFSDAAVVYEKYIRILEVIFDSGQGGLKAEHFKDSARTQELTVLASVYWDLIRIYDTSPKYGERMRQAATKLGQLLKYTPLYPDIVRKAEAFQRTANNPAIVKNFLKSATETKGKCFVATAAFEDADHPTVTDLRLFRDVILEQSSFGRLFVRSYNQFSPPLADWLQNQRPLKPAVRAMLRPVALLARILLVCSCNRRRSLTKSSQNELSKRN